MLVSPLPEQGDSYFPPGDPADLDGCSIWIHFLFRFFSYVVRCPIEKVVQCDQDTYGAEPSGRDRPEVGAWPASLSPIARMPPGSITNPACLKAAIASEGAEMEMLQPLSSRLSRSSEATTSALIT